MLTQIKFRHGTTEEWTLYNPVLALGEPGYDSSSKRFKIGDGLLAWNDLGYTSATAEEMGDLITQIDESIAAANAAVQAANAAAAAAEAAGQGLGREQPNGVAGLDSSGKLFSARLPVTPQALVFLAATTTDTQKAALGLDLVDNVDSTNLPISNAQAAAIATRVSRVKTKRTVAANYTLADADGTEDIVLHITANSATTITLPSDSGASIPQECQIPARQFGTGTTSFQPGTGATVYPNAGTTINKRFGRVLVEKIQANTWMISGDVGAGTSTPPVPVAPSVPLNLTATAQDTAAALAWSAPSSDGGAAITGYIVRRTGATDVPRPASPTTYTATGLTNGTQYQFQVAAVNSAGTGPFTSLVSVTPAGPIQPAVGFSDFMLAQAGLTHYYALNNTYQAQDLKGTLEGANTGGAVTFGAGGAVFNGTAGGYLTIPDSIDMSVRNSNNVFGFFIAITFPTYTQPDQFHFMGKGYDNSSRNNLEWALRLYGDTNTARKRNVSNYYWNPDPSTDINGNPVDNNKGSGAYLAPPAASPDFGGNERHNGPVHSGEIGVEHLFYFEYTYAANYAGRCRLYYGDSFNQMALLGDRAMNADALVTPIYTVGKVYIGKRGDSDGMVKMTARRFATFNQVKTLTQIQSFRTNHLSYGNNEG